MILEVTKVNDRLYLKDPRIEIQLETLEHEEKSEDKIYMISDRPIPKSYYWNKTIATTNEGLSILTLSKGSIQIIKNYYNEKGKMPNKVCFDFSQSRIVYAI